ncbi:Putative beta-lactamase/transpeptidase [Septoria linicola]|uniref:Beta-lactamase/transpeptidase n=1 Tax=Septoria linicola TaxID=215465 RepID=A0A9Q9EKN6_9PEZI|nr:putative beta-lactamase/transpeptidase [Septoria linicola]USW54991.1 Putative beta-lactamase/transpeptidase [Septoria linicola]
MHFSRVLALIATVNIFTQAQYIDTPQNWTYLIQQACSYDPYGTWMPFKPEAQYSATLGYLESIREASMVPGLVAVQADLNKYRCCSSQVGIAMTATLIAKLVEAGAVTWDTTLGEIFKERAFPSWDEGQTFPLNEAYADITLRMVAAHRSGISNDTRYMDVTFWTSELDNGSYEGRRDSLLAWALSQPPFHAVGTRFMYSTTNYIILGAVVDRMSGVFEAVMQQKLFTPLNMDCGSGPAPQRGYRQDELDYPWPHRPDQCYSIEPEAEGDWRADRTVLIGTFDFATLHTAYDIYPDTWSYTPGGWYGDRERGLWHQGTNGYNNAYTYTSVSRRKVFFAYTNLGGSIGNNNGERAVNRVIDAFASDVLDLDQDAAPCFAYQPAITSAVPQFTGYVLPNGELTYESIDTRTLSIQRRVHARRSATACLYCSDNDIARWRGICDRPTRDVYWCSYSEEM